jgi:hypothetical protein
MSKKIVVREAGRETMLYDAEQDELHVLNATARLIYKLSREGKGTAAIEAALRAAFEVPQELDLRREIEACLAALKDKGL